MDMKGCNNLIDEIINARAAGMPSTPVDDAKVLELYFFYLDQVSTLRDALNGELKRLNAEPSESAIEALRKTDARVKVSFNFK